MTDQELDKLLNSSNGNFYKTLNFSSKTFNDWIIKKGYKKKRPVFAKKYSYRSSLTIAKIVKNFYSELVDNSLEYPIDISCKNIGKLCIRETRLLTGKPRYIILDTGEKIEVIDDYFNYYVAHRVFYVKPLLHNEPYLTTHHGTWMYSNILRKIAIKRPKGKFYPFKEMYSWRKKQQK